MIIAVSSFERRTGRSMVAAYVASWFALNGDRVILVDFDLASPGVHEFLEADPSGVFDHGDTAAHPGFLDLIYDYKKRVSTPDVAGHIAPALPLESILPYLVTVPLRSAGVSPSGQLWLLPSGHDRFEAMIDGAVASARWNSEEFYNYWEGTALFEWLRAELLRLADIIVIDAGPSDQPSAAVPLQLADVLISLCTASDKGLRGTRRVLDNARSDEAIAARAGRMLTTLVVPAKIDYSEKTLLEDFYARFEAILGGQSSQNVDPWAFAIPYVPYYSYGDRPAILDAHHHAGRLIVGPIQVLAMVLRDMRSAVTSRPSESVVAVDTFVTLRHKLTNAATVFISYAKEDRGLVLPLYDRLKTGGFRPWLDDKDLAGGQDWRAAIEQIIEQCDFVLVCLSHRSVFKRGFVQREIVWALDLVQSQPEGTVFLIPVRLEDGDVPGPVEIARRLGDIIGLSSILGSMAQKATV